MWVFCYALQYTAKGQFTSVQFSLVQFSLVQFKMVYMLEIVPMFCLIDDGHFSSSRNEDR